MTVLEGRAASGKLEKVEFDQAKLEEVIDFFRSGGGPGRRPVNILVDPKVDQDVTVTLKLRDVSLGEAFAYVAELADFEYREDKHAIRVVPSKGKKRPVPAFLKRGGAMTWRRASQMTMPKVELDSAELSEVVEYLIASSKTLDPQKKGLNIILGHGVDPATPVTLRLQGVPISTVLKYVAEFARLNVRADGPAIVLETRVKPAQ